MNDATILDFSLPATEAADFGPTDLGNAQRFAAAFGEDLRFCHRLGAWFVFDGMRWTEDDGPRVQSKAKAFAAQIIADAAMLPDSEARKAELRHAIYTASARGIANLLALARNELPITPAEMDRDPFLLNCTNGTLDLRSGKMRAHRRDDFITKLAPVAFDHSATLPLWDRFLRDSTGDDPEMIAFLARFAGYCLTGDTGEEKLIFIHGPAASGKSTFVEAFKAALGDYAKTADFETFLARREVGGPRPDLARLTGARFVASVEVEEGRRLAEGLVKMLVW